MRFKKWRYLRRFQIYPAYYTTFTLLPAEEQMFPVLVPGSLVIVVVRGKTPGSGAVGAHYPDGIFIILFHQGEGNEIPLRRPTGIAHQIIGRQEIPAGLASEIKNFQS